MKAFVCLLMGLAVLMAQPAYARDTHHMYSIESALNTTAAKEKLTPTVRLYFGDQKHAAVAKNFGEVMTNRKTNAFGKSDLEACQWVFLSAMIALQERAVQEGGNAVVNIRSYYRKNLVSTTTEYECGAGAMVAGVTFKGDVVTLK